MSRTYQYESHVMPTFTGSGSSGLVDVGRRFLPGGISLSITGITGGSYTIHLKLSPAVGGSGGQYVDPATGATVFTVERVFVLPPFDTILVAGVGVGGTVQPVLGAIAFSPNL